jgi:IS30 family transposase
VTTLSRASSACAAKFLDKIISTFPFPVVSIQVDGGSEFMKDFETACQEKNIPLFVLPPRSPKLNGGVEHCNKTSRHEFYQ